MKKLLSKTTDRADDLKTIWVFTPSRTDPKDLEFILVQREELLADAVERVKESALTDHKHHLLFVGPRGCGKTHLVTLIVNRLSEAAELAEHLRIAWLNEDETCTTLLEFLFKVHAALEKRYPDEFRGDMLDAAYEMKQADAQEFMSNHLISSLDSRTLLVVTENLDAIFEGMGDAGQKRLRAFIQENPKLSIVATAQRLVEDLSNRNSPFFGFFQTEHLKPLNVEQATDLLQNIARLQKKDSVVEFLATSRGRSRVRAIHHLSGGNYRIYIVLSQFITRDSVDALLEPFMKMVDELTPYYQERIRWLPPMQRKIVEYLCVCEGTVPVKEIAKRLFASQQTISSQLQDLREKGYVQANRVGRTSLYEICEPLMRICVEVKDNQRHQPFRLLVDFLRVWYEDHELKDRLGKMAPASTACAYLESAIQRNQVEGNLRKKILIEELQSSLPEKWPSAIRDGMIQELGKAPEGLLLAMQNVSEGKRAEAILCLDEVIAKSVTSADRVPLLFLRASLHSSLEERAKEISDYTTVIDLPDTPVNQVANALINRGGTYGQVGDTQSELADYTALIDLPSVSVNLIARAYLNRGIACGEAGDTQGSIADYTALIGLSGAPVDQVAIALINRGETYGQIGDTRSELADYSAVINLPDAPVDQVAMAYFNRGIAHGQAGNTPCELADYTAVINLPGALVDRVAAALLNRGVTHSEAGDTQRAIDDYAALIDLPGASVDNVARALFSRGATHFNESRKKESLLDFEALIRLPEVPEERVVDAYLALSELHFSEGMWSEGFQALQASLGRGAKAQPAYQESATDLIDAVFAAGLSPDGRCDKVKELLRIYQDYQSLAVVGEAVVQHIGSVFRSGEPFPSTDNLEGWVSAWEEAAKSAPDFRLSVRLLRTAVDYVKAGGKDRGILLTLTAPERAILEQALGLTGKDGA